MYISAEKKITFSMHREKKSEKIKLLKRNKMKRNVMGKISQEKYPF